MLSKPALRQSLEMTLAWYENSGIMIPENGLWGVAERVLLLKDNKTAHHTMNSFPAWTPHKDFCVIEQRRADCCMEAAFLFLKIHEIFGEKKHYVIAHNILSFLYNRSGLLTRTGGEKIEGVWNWSHISRRHNIYFDDDAWMVALPLKIAAQYPEFDQEFEMRNWALKLADLIADAFPRYFKNEKETEELFSWAGNTKLPHWGSLVCQALAEASKIQPKEQYRTVIDSYHRFLLEKQDTFTTSEFGYALLGASASYMAFNDELSRKTAQVFADKIVASMDPGTGNMPSQHYEAPSGASLADTIYTLNWAVLALQNMARIDPKYIDPYEKIMNLLLKIQDTTREKYLFGCWRGMFDLENGQWGGGDRFEGGANSIYSGWTNAPIPWAVAFAVRNTSLANS